MSRFMINTLLAMIFSAATVSADEGAFSVSAEGNGMALLPVAEAKLMELTAEIDRTIVVQHSELKQSADKP